MKGDGEGVDKEPQSIQVELLQNQDVALRLINRLMQIEPASNPLIYENVLIPPTILSS